jgi:hypothetical protein
MVLQLLIKIIIIIETPAEAPKVEEKKESGIIIMFIDLFYSLSFHNYTFRSWS